MQSVTGREDLHPESATLLGPCKVIPQEYPHMTCRSIDVELPDMGSPERRRLVELLLQELISDASDGVVAFRGNYRWVQTFEPVRLGKAVAGHGLLRPGGAYLITGGLGNIGMVLAGHIARTVHAKLVLIGRSWLPDRAERARWVSTHGPEDRVVRRIKRVWELERMGAEVMVCAANVADEEQMRVAIDDACRRFGAINGVFHAAGFVERESFAFIPNVDHQASDAHFNPKARGLYVIERVLEGRRPDFFILLSSISAVLGGLRYSAYAAANAFMDAFAQMRDRAADVPWLSINWDAWKREDDDATAGTTLAEFAIAPEEGADAFQRILAAGRTGQVIVSTGDLHERLCHWMPRGGDQDPAMRKAAVSLAAHARPALLNAYVPPADDTQRLIADIWQELLGLAQVGIHDNFFELGGHSLLASRVISRLRKALHVDVPVRAIFEAPTIAELNAWIGRQGLQGMASEAALRLLEEVEGLSEEDARRMLLEDDGQVGDAGSDACPQSDQPEER
jgi:hypothetical protein